jgi:GWxTD domain-containing protein
MMSASALRDTRRREGATGFTRFVRLRACLAAFVALLLGGGAEARAQPAGSTDRSAEQAIDEAVAAVRDGRPARAIQRLAPMIQQNPTPSHPEHGNAAAWLGRAFAAAGDTSQAQRVWLQGVRSAGQNGGSAVGAADAFLRSLAPQVIRKNPRSSTYAYRHLVARLGRASGPAAREALRRHGAQLALILPDDLASALETALETAREGVPEEAAPGGPDADTTRVGRRLLSWWRSQDPVVSTTANERMLEHLVRVRVAERRYPWPDRASGDRPSGLDDRGQVYVRLGPPGRTASVEFEAGSRWTVGTCPDCIRIPVLRQALSEANLGMGSFPPENAVWFYPQISSDAYYVFVESGKRGGPLVAGTPRDLVPSKLRGAIHPEGRDPGNLSNADDEGGRAGFFGASEGGGGGGGTSWPPKMIAKYAVLLSIHEQLALEHGDFGTRYEELVNKPTQTNPVQHLNTRSRDFKTRDRQAAELREEVVPRQQTSTLGNTAPLHVATRTARFLDEDGTTRTEVYWSTRIRDLVPPEDWQDRALKLGGEVTGRYRLQSTQVVQAADRTPIGRSVRRDTVIARAATDRPLPTRAMVAPGNTGTHHLAMEWIERSVASGGSNGSLVRFGQARIDSVQALDPDPGRLQMSDVMLLDVPEDGAPLPAGRDEARRRVVPFDTLAAGQSVALGFELYHLTFGGGDQTRYAVEYEVERRRDRGGLAGLFGGISEEKTATRSTYTGSSRRSMEYILLDLAEAPGDRPVDVTVTVRVTDETSGQTVERDIGFVVRPEEG